MEHTLRRGITLVMLALLAYTGWTAEKSNHKPDDPVRIILDTDFGDDGDDLISLVMLHYFQDLGEAEILAVGQANTNRESPGAIDVINTYYNRPDIPIGIARGTLHGSADQYSSFLIDHYPELTDLNLDNVPDAVDVYRRVLADAPDHSVNMVVIGFKRNMADLLKSGPDGYSDLNGTDLVALKVKEVYDMGGKYPYSNSLFNFGMDCEATDYYLENWPTPMIFAGEGCGGIEVGNRVRNELTPVGRAMEEKLRYGWRPNESGQPGFDCAATLAAVRGVDTYFNTKRGCNDVFNCSTSPTVSFDYEVDCGHLHIDALNQKVSFHGLGDMIQDWVIAGPDDDRVKVIWDTDMQWDWDDAGALALLHALADSGEAEILGIGSSTRGEAGQWNPHTIDAINSYYNRPHIPIGKSLSGPDLEDTYGQWISEQGFSYFLEDGQVWDNVVDLYRKLLSAQPDTSVVLVTVGYTSNIRDLLLSEPDEYSSLNGIELVAEKVKFWSCMGGRYPGNGAEANFQDWKGHTKFAIENFPRPILGTSSEAGNVSGAGSSLEYTPDSNPVRAIYRKRLDEQGYPNTFSHCTWDLIATLVAVREAQQYFDVSSSGNNVITLDGNQKTLNEWQPQPDKGYRYLIQTDPERVSKVLDELVGRAPALPVQMVELHVSVSGDGSVYPSDGQFRLDTTVTLYVSPDTCYELAFWYGDLSGNKDSVTLVMNSNKNITAFITEIVDCKIATNRSPRSRGECQTSFGLTNYPNPFSDQTFITYELMQPSDVTLVIYNMEGKALASWIKPNQQPGSYRVGWAPNTDPERKLTAGVYLCRLRVGNVSQTTRLSLTDRF